MFTAWMFSSVRRSALFSQPISEIELNSFPEPPILNSTRELEELLQRRIRRYINVKHWVDIAERNSHAISQTPYFIKSFCDDYCDNSVSALWREWNNTKKNDKRKAPTPLPHDLTNDPQQFT
jgi:hypothetical protein